jgi:hypothetical protein
MTTDLGVLSVGDAGGFFNSFDSGEVFEDIYTFKVATAANFGTTVLNFNIAPEILDWDINPLSVAFESHSGDFSWSGTTTTLLGGTLDNLTVSIPGLDPALFYRLRIFGTVIGEDGGGYVANYKVAAVPLPPAVVLFGIGLVAVFGISRRMKTV